MPRKPKTKTTKVVKTKTVPVKTTRKSYTRRHARVPRSGMTRFYLNDPFRPKMFTNLTYSAQGYLTVNSNTQQFGTETQFQLNDPYAPYVAGGAGPQNTSALGLLECAALYNRMKVWAVTATVDFFGPFAVTSTVPALGVVGGVIINNPSNLSDTITAVDYGRVAKLPMAWVRDVSAFGKGHQVFKQKFQMYQLFNLTKRQYTDDITNTTAATNGSPATKCQLCIAIADSQGNGAVRQCQYEVTLTYHVEFYQRKELAV